MPCWTGLSKAHRHSNSRMSVCKRCCDAGTQAKVQWKQHVPIPVYTTWTTLSGTTTAQECTAQCSAQPNCLGSLLIPWSASAPETVCWCLQKGSYLLLQVGSGHVSELDLLQGQGMALLGLGGLLPPGLPLPLQSPDVLQPQPEHSHTTCQDLFGAKSTLSGKMLAIACNPHPQARHGGSLEP